MDALSERLTALGLHTARADSQAGSRMPSPVPGYPPAFYSSPPPGVPLLRTPLPGSMQSPPPMPPPGAPPSPYPQPVASPYPSPAPLPPHSAGARFPSHDGSGTGPVPRSSSSGRNLLLAIVGLVVIGGGVAVFALARGGDKAGGPAQPEQGGVVPAPDPAGDDDPPDTDDDEEDEDDSPPVPPAPSDFSITPDRPLYDPGGATDTAATPSGSVDDGIWKGGWWAEPTGLFKLAIPAGFSQGSMMGLVSQFAGSCGPVPCTIRGVSFPTPGQNLDVDQVTQVLGQLPVAGAGKPRNVRKQKIGGRRCVLLDFDNSSEGYTGEMALCPGQGTVPAIAVQTFPKDFAASKSFRAAFFGKGIQF
jgi:hypothetical protein